MRGLLWVCVKRGAYALCATPVLSGAASHTDSEAVVVRGQPLLSPAPPTGPVATPEPRLVIS